MLSSTTLLLLTAAKVPAGEAAEPLVRLAQGTSPQTALQAAAPAAGLDSLYDMVMSGGPLMIPIGLCSIIALAYTVERSVRLGSGRLGGPSFARQILGAVREGGPQRALELCEGKNMPLARILSTALHSWTMPMLEREKAVEDAGAREVRRLSANLRPLVVVAAISPLLGLLGTVWGMIQAFSQIALKEGLGKPELLASGISQALITTAAGLAIAIPTQAAYYYFKSRIERFTRRAEDTYAEITETMRGRAQAA